MRNKSNETIYLKFKFKFKITKWKQIKIKIRRSSESTWGHCRWTLSFLTKTQQTAENQRSKALEADNVGTLSFQLQLLSKPQLWFVSNNFKLKFEMKMNCFVCWLRLIRFVFLVRWIRWNSLSSIVFRVFVSFSMFAFLGPISDVQNAQNPPNNHFKSRISIEIQIKCWVVVAVLADDSRKIKFQNDIPIEWELLITMVRISIDSRRWNLNKPPKLQTKSKIQMFSKNEVNSETLTEQEP